MKLRLAFLLASALGVFACSSSSSPSVSTPTKDSGGDDAGGGSDTGASDTGAPCNTLKSAGVAVTFSNPSTAPPTAAGGTIEDGTYAFTTYAVYGGDAGGSPLTAGATVTVSVSGGTWQVLATDSGEANVTGTVDVTTTGDSFTTTTTCGPSDTFFGNSGTYTATATQFTIIESAAGITVTQTFTKQ